MTNTNFALFPFEHKGIQFVSKVAETCDYLPQILNIGEAFIQMNIDAVDSFMPNLEELSTEEILEAIADINEGGTEMFLELAGA